MKKSKGADTYIEKLNEDRRIQLSQIRDFIFRVIPDVKESMYYKMPTYELGEKICAIASQKNYLAVYIIQHEIIEHYLDDFSHLSVGKSCIRFKSLADFPFETFENILLESVEMIKS